MKVFNTVVRMVDQTFIVDASEDGISFESWKNVDIRCMMYILQVPVSPLAIHGGNGHKVTVGVSDAYYVDKYLEGKLHYI